MISKGKKYVDVSFLRSFLQHAVLVLGTDVSEFVEFQIQTKYSKLIRWFVLCWFRNFFPTIQTMQKWNPNMKDLNCLEMSSRIPFVFFQILKHDIKSKWTLDIRANHEVQRRRRYKIKSETARFLLFRDPKYKLDHKLHLESRIVKVFLKRFANSFAWWTFVKTMKNLTWELISMKSLMKFYSGTCIHLWVILQLKNFVQWRWHLWIRKISVWHRKDSSKNSKIQSFLVISSQCGSFYY